MIAKSKIEVAIVGGGPGGLGTAIALSKLPFLSVTLYEQNPEPREAGAGISLSTNAWRILDLLGAGQLVKGGSKTDTHQRNAYNGNVLLVSHQPEAAEDDPRGAIRARRTRLQAGLLAKVPEGIIQYSKKLVSLENLPGNEGARIKFQDGTEVVADLVVGADGLKSRVRTALFPDHELHFTGNIAFRTLIPKKTLDQIPDITNTTAWWWGKDGHVYFSEVDDPSETDKPDFEITVRAYRQPEIPNHTVFWGIPATNERVQSQVATFDKRIQDAVATVPEGKWYEFNMYAGPRLETIIGWDKVALIGDASHPLSGAFGSGATFALEDGWILARALEYVHDKKKSKEPVRDALRIFNEIREPYYAKMYSHLDEKGVEIKKLQAATDNFDEQLKAKVELSIYGDKDFIYRNDIAKTWKDYVEKQEQ